MNKNLKKLQEAKLIYKNSFLTEWQAIKTDKAVLSSFIMICFVILAVYTYIYSNEVVTEIPVAIVDKDNSQTSRNYINMLNSSSYIITNTSFSNIENAKRAYYKNQVMGLVVIPKNFEKEILQSKPLSVVIFADASNMIFYKNVLATVNQITTYFNANIAIKKEVLKGTPVHIAKQQYNPINLVSRSLFNTSSGYATYITPIFISLIIQLVIFLGIGILNGTRKENNLLYQHYYGIVKKGGVIPTLLAKATVYVILFAIILPVQIIVVQLAFNIPFRTSIIPILIYSLPYLISVVFLGITISSMFKRREEAILFLVLLSLPALMLSGVSFPTESFPKFHQYLANLLPSTPGIQGFVKLTQLNASFNQITTQWKHLWLLALLYFITSAIVLKIQYSNVKK